MNNRVGHSSKKINTDGTSQGARSSRSLTPSSFLVDDRSVDDLMEYVEKYADVIQYYDQQNRPNGSWRSFFQEEAGDHPHFKLFRAFLECFKHTQAHLNTIPKRHLDLYLDKIIGFNTKKAIPDKAYITFQLAKNIGMHKIQKGTSLQAGKDKNGKTLSYKTTKDIALNQAIIEESRSIFIDSNNGEVESGKKIFSSIRELPSGTEWFAFGSPPSLSDPDTVMDRTTLGFALSSPLFYLQGGHRTIEIKIQCEKQASDNQSEWSLDQGKLERALIVTWSQEEDWSSPLEVDLEINFEREIELTFLLELGADDPAFVVNEELFMKEAIASKWPLLKVHINPSIGIPDIFQWLMVKEIHIGIKASSFPYFTLQSDHGKLDPSKPFNPFGLSPKIGSSFYLGSKEIFSKSVSSVDIDLEWMELPPEGFKDHYQAYGKVDTSSFKMGTSILEKGSWQPLAEGVPLFEETQIENEGTEKKIVVNENRSIVMGLSDRQLMLTNDYKEEIYRSTTVDGFLKMELSHPVMPMQAFGHSEFVGLNTAAILSLTNTTDDDGDLALPKSPYTPMVKSIQLSYSAEQNISVHTSNDDVQFFYLEPFGNKQVSVSHGLLLFPEYTEQGYLFLKVTGLKPPQNFSILFHIADGSADPKEEANIAWSFLTEKGWKSFSASQVLSDTTEKLQVSGIIEFEIPKEASQLATLMPESAFWIRANVTNYKAVGKFISLGTQAVEVEFVDQENDPDHLKHPLPKDRINKLENKDSAIKKISQPFSSWGGKIKESGDDLYIRASERLRHKNRAVTTWDYERIILDRFPSIYKVKCLGHTNLSGAYAPGNVTLVVLPRVLNRTGVNTLAPKATGKLLLEIKNYIKNYVSDWVDVTVLNPEYQEIRVEFNVSFTVGVDKGYHLQLLNEEIIGFLSPWITDSSKEIVFGGKIYKSAIIDFIERRKYVDFITDFKFFSVDKEEGINRMTVTRKDSDESEPLGQIDFEVFLEPEVAEPRDAKSILISASSHQINIVDGSREPKGIGTMATEVELLIT
ncbi:baseplate J/gp47 family protein [Ekhidna sp.]